MLTQQRTEGGKTNERKRVRKKRIREQESKGKMERIRRDYYTGMEEEWKEQKNGWKGGEKKSKKKTETGRNK